MRTLLVLTSTYPRWKGDVEPEFVHLLCRRLSSHYRVIVLAPHFPGAAREERLDGILVYRFRYFLSFAETLAYDGGITSNLKGCRAKYLLVPFFAIGQLLALGSLCHKQKIDLIHAHWIIPQGLIAVITRRFFCGKARLLCTSHGGDLFGLRGGILQAIKRYVIHHCDHLTVVSTAMKRRLQSLGIPDTRVTVQPMGVDLREKFVPAPKAPKEADLIFVGRLVEKKGVRTLIEAAHILKPEFPNLTLRIVGDGPERAALERQVANLQLTGFVEFLGAKPNDQVPACYHSAKIAVVPSIIAVDGDQEGLGLVAVEAMGCGCATIVSDLPAMQDVVQDNINGLVFHSSDATDLALKIRTLLTRADMRERLSSRGRETVSQRFDWHKVGSRYQQLIEQCLTA